MIYLGAILETSKQVSVPVAIQRSSGKCFLSILSNCQLALRDHQSLRVSGKFHVAPLSLSVAVTIANKNVNKPLPRRHSETQTTNHKPVPNPHEPVPKEEPEPAQIYAFASLTTRCEISHLPVRGAPSLKIQDPSSSSRGL